MLRENRIQVVGKGSFKNFQWINYTTLEGNPTHTLGKGQNASAVGGLLAEVKYLRRVRSIHFWCMYNYIPCRIFVKIYSIAFFYSVLLPTC